MANCTRTCILKWIPYHYEHPDMIWYHHHISSAKLFNSKTWIYHIALQPDIIISDEVFFPEIHRNINQKNENVFTILYEKLCDLRNKCIMHVSSSKLQLSCRFYILNPLCSSAAENKWSFLLLRISLRLLSYQVFCC